MESENGNKYRANLTWVAAVAAVAVLVRVLFHLHTGFIFDDAFITFRYAENIAAGHGFVYNLGERVLGTTSPLFTFVLAGAAFLGISVSGAALTISLIASAVTAGLVFRIAECWQFGRLAVVPALAYAMFPRLLPTDTGGMETALFTSMVMGVFYLLTTRRPHLAMVIASLATLVRPEGGLLIFLVLIAASICDRKHVVGCLTLAIVIGLPWLLFAHGYFGSAIPHSITAKLALYGEVWARSLLERVIFVMGWHNPLGWALSVFGVWGAILLSRRQLVARYAIAWLVISLGLLIVSSTMVFIWYMSPTYPLWLTLASFPMVWICQRLAERGRMVTIGVSLVGVLALALFVVSDVRTARYYRLDEAILTGIHSDLVRYIEDHGSPADTIATEDIGWVGYHSGNYIIDRAGLVSPMVPPLNRTRHYAAVIANSYPDWVIVSPWDPTSDFLGSRDFMRTYCLCGIFSHPENQKWEFLLFKRRESANPLRYCPGR